MRPLRILVTAGPTREYIDPVRFISNDSSGKMGFAIAAAAAQRGHAVTLIHGPVALPAPPAVSVVSVISARDMLRACVEHWPRYDALIMAAAVADYTPAAHSDEKLKKTGDEMTLKLAPTADVLATLSKNRDARQTVIGFALESHNGRANAASKLTRKNLDAIVLNHPAAIGVDRSVVEILTRDGVWNPLPDAPKDETAVRIVELAESIAAGRLAAPSESR
ncbi:MAG: hypothetical protein KDA32_00290 [Phycisphaerales bacterium]|nr:hypothetical protein [Phycisphaerales bacterium]